MRDQLRFLKCLAERPRMTGAVAPSGEALAKAMARHVDPDGDLPIVELGPGTGVVTKALIGHGVAPERIIAIEYSPDFCRLLAERFPGITVIRGDAYDLDGSLDGRAPEIANVVSSLPLVARPLSDREQLIQAGLARTVSDNPFIQFSYTFNGPVQPVPGRFSAQASRWIWMNMPPARVWLYRKA
ncbi:class I SAM-dependent methyltransferase [Bauldia sp.]|uniref:class I SAM-dependent methyltransferase n=1 Tax=Bauldia sp. TaxID=2575872 RepID=UPI003BAAC178